MCVRHLLRVSVPSTGRSGLQPRAAPRNAKVVKSFSTLYGSKWVATCVPGRRRNSASGFQYPLRVEVGCNVNAVRSALVAPLSFSTLYGSKWVATSSSAHHALSMALKFQYPLRVEVGCNTTRRGCAAMPQRFQYPLRVEVGCNICHYLTKQILS